MFASGATEISTKNLTISPKELYFLLWRLYKGSFRYSFIRDSIMTCGDLRTVKGWVERLILRENSEGLV